jgi:hypothetical protein
MLALPAIPLFFGGFTVKKADMIREALEKKIDSPTQIKAYVKEHHKEDVSGASITTVKKAWKKANRKTSKAPVVIPEVAPPGVTAPTGHENNGDMKRQGNPSEVLVGLESSLAKTVDWLGLDGTKRLIYNLLNR